MGTKMFLKASLTAGNTGTWVDNVGYHMINSVELQVGGTKIDKHYGLWLQIWHELARNSNHDNGLAAILTPPTAAGTTELFVPLQFFCCRNDGLALPLIALQYHC